MRSLVSLVLSLITYFLFLTETTIVIGMVMPVPRTLITSILFSNMCSNLCYFFDRGKVRFDFTGKMREGRLV